MDEAHSRPNVNLHFPEFFFFFLAAKPVAVQLPGQWGGGEVSLPWLPGTPTPTFGVSQLCPPLTASVFHPAWDRVLLALTGQPS